MSYVSHNTFHLVTPVSVMQQCFCCYVIACPVDKSFLVFSNTGSLYIFMLYSLCVTLLTSTVF